MTDFVNHGTLINFLKNNNTSLYTSETSTHGKRAKSMVLTWIRGKIFSHCLYFSYSFIGWMCVQLCLFTEHWLICIMEYMHPNKENMCKVSLLFVGMLDGLSLENNMDMLGGYL